MSYTPNQRRAKQASVARGIFSSGKYQVAAPRCKAMCQKCGEEVDQLFPTHPAMSLRLMVCRQCKAEEKK